uniref:Uncharacterized protein n=1 Tax=Anopheles coluzzii TaxID=1518534 RepID=A0A8W7PPG4_ANOCL
MADGEPMPSSPSCNAVPTMTAIMINAYTVDSICATSSCMLDLQVKHTSMNSMIERGPVVDLERGHERTHQHEENRTGAKDRTAHQHHLVEDVQQRDVVVDLDRAPVVHQQVHNVGDGGRYPAATLVVELVEPFRAVGVGVRGSRVLDAIATLQQQRTQPTILALIVLHVVPALYIGVTNSFSVLAKRSHLGVQMCSVIQVCESNHSNQAHAIWREAKSFSRKTGGLSKNR